MQHSRALPALTLMVGVDTGVFHGYVNCGAKGAITGVGNGLPREVLHLAALCEKAAQGDATARRQAQELEAALMVLSTFDEGVDLVLFYKYLMTLEGNAEYELHFNPTDAARRRRSKTHGRRHRHRRPPRLWSAVQRKEPVAVGGRAHGERHRADIQPCGRRRPERQQCGGQLTLAAPLRGPAP